MNFFGCYGNGKSCVGRRNFKTRYACSAIIAKAKCRICRIFFSHNFRDFFALHVLRLLFYGEFLCVVCLLFGFFFALLRNNRIWSALVARCLTCRILLHVLKVIQPRDASYNRNQLSGGNQRINSVSLWCSKFSDGQCS